jgi:uncharacterized protein (DUF58 family)
MLPTGALMLEDTLPAGMSGRARFVLDGLRGRESRSVTYRIPGLNRGRHVIGPLRLRSSDPFSMIDLTRSFNATTGVVVTPVVEILDGPALARAWGGSQSMGSQAIGAHGADDASTREYRHGDDLRKIHWRTTARAGALMVRHEERPWQGQATLLLDTRANAHRSARTPPDAQPDPRRHSSFEWAISCTASIGSQLLRTGRETSLVAGSSASRFPATAGAELLDQLAMLAPSTRPDLGPAIEALRGAIRESTVIAVLGHLDPQSVRMLSQLHPRGSSGTALAIALDTASWTAAGAATMPGPVQPGPALGDAPPAVEDPTWLESVAVLRACGWWVTAARSGDSVASVWAALLQQRLGRESGHPGAR